jgi:hypothetical protein
MERLYAHPVHFLSYLTQIFLERDMFQTEVVKKIKTHSEILCSMTFCENRAIHVIMWKNVVDAGRPQMAIWHMRITC